MTTTEKNVVIAEFIGWEQKEIPIDAQGTRWEFNGFTGFIGNVSDNLYFHESYDWLIPVFVKASTEIRSVSKRNRAYHNGPMLVHEAGQQILNGEIKEAHEKLFQAIQWYNENKQP